MPRLPQATHPQAKLLTEHCDVGIGAKPGLLRLGGSGDRTGLQQVTEALNGAQLDSARPGSGRVLLSCGSTAPETRRFLHEIVFPTSNSAESGSAALFSDDGSHIWYFFEKLVETTSNHKMKW